MSTEQQQLNPSLITELLRLNSDYQKNCVQIEANNALQMKEKHEKKQKDREAAAEVAVLHIVKNVEETMKRVAQYGRRDRTNPSTFIPRTECCFYKWDASSDSNLEQDDTNNTNTTNNEADSHDEATDHLENGTNRFNGFTMNDLIRNANLVGLLQAWFDRNHTTNNPESRRAFYVFSRKMLRFNQKHQSSEFGLFVNWNQADWPSKQSFQQRRFNNNNNMSQQQQQQQQQQPQQHQQSQRQPRMQEDQQQQQQHDQPREQFPRMNRGRGSSRGSMRGGGPSRGSRGHPSRQQASEVLRSFRPDL